MGAPRQKQEFQVFWWGWGSKRRNRTRVMSRGKEWKKWTKMEEVQEFACGQLLFLSLDSWSLGNSKGRISRLENLYHYFISIRQPTARVWLHHNGPSQRFRAKQHWSQLTHKVVSWAYHWKTDWMVLKSSLEIWFSLMIFPRGYCWSEIH